MSAFEAKMWDELDYLVDTDTLGLRDYAWAATCEVTRLANHLERAHQTVASLDTSHAELSGQLQDAREKLALRGGE